MKNDHVKRLTFNPECWYADCESQHYKDDENKQKYEAATHRPFLRRQRQFALRLVQTPPGDATVAGEHFAVALATLARRHYERARGDLERHLVGRQSRCSFATDLRFRSFADIGVPLISSDAVRLGNVGGRRRLVTRRSCQRLGSVDNFSQVRILQRSTT